LDLIYLVANLSCRKEFLDALYEQTVLKNKVCHNCGRRSAGNRSDSATIQLLSLNDQNGKFWPDGTHVSSLIAGTFGEEDLTDMICGDTENGVVIEGTGCGVRDRTVRSTVLDAAPEILMLQFQRAIMDWNKGTTKRCETRIEYDLSLDLSRFQKPRYRGSNALRYRLTTVIMHSGDAKGGHYVAYNVQPDGTVKCANDNRITRGTINNLLGRNVPVSRMFGRPWLPFLLTYVRILPNHRTGAPRPAVALNTTEKALTVKGITNLSERPGFGEQIHHITKSDPELLRFTGQDVSYDAVNNLPSIVQQKLYNLVQKTQNRPKKENMAKESQLRSWRAVVKGVLPKLASRQSFHRAVAHVLNSHMSIKLDIDNGNSSLEGLDYDILPESVVSQLYDLVEAEIGLILIEGKQMAEEEQRRKATNAKLKAQLLDEAFNDRAIGIIVGETDVVIDQDDGLKGVDFDALDPSIIERLNGLIEAERIQNQQR